MLQSLNSKIFRNHPNALKCIAGRAFLLWKPPRLHAAHPTSNKLIILHAASLFNISIPCYNATLLQPIRSATVSNMQNP